jgi:uncharacterized membrane protein YdbT with pleckstrin-like domain
VLRLCGVAQLLVPVAVSSAVAVVVAVAVAVATALQLPVVPVLWCASDVPILRQFCGDSVVYPR